MNDPWTSQISPCAASATSTLPKVIASNGFAVLGVNWIWPGTTGMMPPATATSPRRAAIAPRTPTGTMFLRFGDSLIARSNGSFCGL
jgi:hypothetical protein